MMRSNSQPSIPQPQRTCPFFQQGTCRFGCNCRDQPFAYTQSIDPRSALTAEEEQELMAELEKPVATRKESEDNSTCVRTIFGAVVTFGAGVGVVDIKIPSEFEFGKWIRNDMVICTWFRPAAIAFLAYHDLAALHNAAQILLKTPTPYGGSLHCTLVQPGTYDYPNQFTLEVRGIHANCDENWFKSILVSKYPIKMKVEEPEYDTQPHESRDTVEALLQSIGPINETAFYNDPKKAQLVLNASFANADNVAKAVKELQATEHADLGRIFVRSMIRIEYSVPTKVAQALLPALERLQQNIKTQNRAWLDLPSSKNTQKPSDSLRIAVCGENGPSLLAKVKMELEKLLEGTIVKSVQGPLWHSFFGTAAAHHFLASVSDKNRLYVHRDVLKSRLLLYGGSLSSREHVQKVLVGQVADVNKIQRAWASKQNEIKIALTSSFSKVRSFFHGEEFEYDEDEVSLTRMPVALSEDCCACWTETQPREALKFSCGHTYCRECFTNQVEIHEFPFRCAGQIEERQCVHLFTIPELQPLVDNSTFEVLLQASFQAYIRTHPALYQYCPTPDCPSIYQIPAGSSGKNNNNNTTDLATRISTNLLCNTCLDTICTRCQAIFHEGMTCPEYKDSLNKETNEAYMQENGIKRCPNCRTLIEKIEGCNHIVCTGCRVHICWVCLETFAGDNDCYGHLHVEHGGHGGAELNEEEDEERFGLANLVLRDG